MRVSNSVKIFLCLGLLIAGSIILFAVKPSALLFLYKKLYTPYVHLTKHKFTQRFNDAQLAAAIDYAKTQPWVQKQIQEDLAPFAQGISREQVDYWYKNLQDEDNKLVKFTVKNKIVSADAPAEYKKLRSYKTVNNVVTILAEKGYIPDCEFVIALYDHLKYAPTDMEPAAIFTFAKHTEVPLEKNTILIPDWMNVRYWDYMRSRIALANKIYPWERKQPYIYWRGGIADSMHHREKLIELQPKLGFLDVGFTQGPNALPRVDPEFSLLNKYQIALDGTRATWERLVWQMFSKSVIIKPNSPQIQWFHKGLEPYKTYVPIKDVDEINIASIYIWLQVYDKSAKEIAINAHNFAQDNFKCQDFFAYYALVLQEYAKLYHS